MSAPATEAALLALEALRETLTARYQCEWRGTASACNCLDCRCDRAIARLRATPPTAEPAAPFMVSAAEAASGTLAKATADRLFAETAPAATDVEPVAKVARVSTGEVIWHPAGVPLTVGMHLYSAAQLAAAEQRGRASAEARCERLREALARVATVREGSQRIACDALTADDAAKEAGR
ncbi:MAG: hypothetical protein WC273_10635 [Dehalococcoidia bacterium]